MKHKYSVVTEEVYQGCLGALGSVAVHVVDGTRIRDLIEIDFVAGGNSGRYFFVPNDEIWIEENLNERDRAATIVHEFVERKLMLRGWTYSKAHDVAAGIEKSFRGGSYGRGVVDAARVYLKEAGWL